MTVHFDDSPFLTIWETTQSCLLACKHCRASAQPSALAGELTTEEGKSLLKSIWDMGCRIVVLSGGDPFQRSDLEELISYGKSLGLRMATVPAATEKLTESRIKSIKLAGIDQVAVSIDFPVEDLHDNFRRVPGAFHKSIQAAKWIKDHGISLQINTTVTKTSLPYLEEMGDFVDSLGVSFWEVFFLIPMGRGSELEALTSEECERAFSVLAKLHQQYSYILKVTEAPHYRRYLLEHHPDIFRSKVNASFGTKHSIGQSSATVNAGKGFMFVSYKGDIYPSGFLPMDTGNVRYNAVADVYRNHPVFKKLRDVTALEGKCGICEYVKICGGSRSRAYSYTKDYLAEEPWCYYEPKKMNIEDRVVV